MPRPGQKRLVCCVKLVKFCPPSPCTENQAVAVVDYRLACGHVLRRRHYGANAYRVQKGQSIAPAAMICPTCSWGAQRCAC